MKKLIIFCLFVLSVGVMESYACDEIYFKVGAGYKFEEMKTFNYEGEEHHFTELSPYSARFELGVQKGNISYGVSHHSQWSTGVPFNNKGEPYKTEVFVDFKFTLF